MKHFYTVSPQRTVVRNGRIYAVPKPLSLTERIANKTRAKNPNASMNLAVIKVM